MTGRSCGLRPARSARGIPSSRTQISLIAGRLVSQVEVCARCLRALAEQVDGSTLAGGSGLEGTEDEHVLAADVQGLPAGHEELEPVGRVDESGHVGRGVHDVLEVVEHQQEVPAGYRGCKLQ